LFNAPGSKEVELTYGLNIQSDWPREQFPRIIPMGNDFSLHDLSSEYSFKRHIFSDLKKKYPDDKFKAGEVSVASVRLAHLSYTRSDHHRPDRDHGGYVRDMEFVYAVANSR
ncbi:MAG: hypothetical protein V3T30_07935, partial [Thermodesulfobacteriota bacterium]